MSVLVRCALSTVVYYLAKDEPPGSELRVQPNGSFSYVMFSQNPAQSEFPVACHAQLAVEPKGKGIDGPVGITFTSRTGIEARTFSSERSTSSQTKSSSSSSTSSPAVSATDSSSSRDSSTSATSLTSPTELQARPSNTSVSESASAQQSISTGAKAGIGVGAGAVVLLLVVLLFFFFKKRRASSGTGTAQVDPDLSYGNPRYGRHELEDETRRVHELDSESARRTAELEAKHKSMRSHKSVKSHKSKIYELP